MILDDMGRAPAEVASAINRRDDLSEGAFFGD